MSERLNTQDLIDLLVNRQGLEKKEAELFVKEFFSLIEEGLEKDKFVKIKGLGTFKLIDVGSRESVDVNTGERIEIQGHTKISFVPDTTLRNVINKPFAHFETVILNDDIDFDDLQQEVPEKTEPMIEPEKSEDINNTEKNKEPAGTISNERTPDFQKDNISEEIKTDNSQETPLPAAKENSEKTDSNNNKTLTLVVILTILICGTLLFFTYFSDIFPEKKKQPPVSVAPPVKTEVTTDSIPVDSVKNSPMITETPKAENPVIDSPPATNKKKVPFSKIPVTPDSTNYEIVGTKTLHTIREGETLIRISYRYYGTKDLFPYLIMHNRSIIKNPNSVPLGTVINIPELRKK